MNKESQIKLAMLLDEAGNALRKLAQEKEALTKRAEDLEHLIRASKLAQSMIEHGAAAHLGSSTEAVEEALRTKTAAELQRYEDALAMFGPNMGEKMGKLASQGGSSDGAGSASSRAAVENLFQP